MSLIKQLWLAIIIMMVLAFGGSLVASTLSSKHYLEQQLQMKNIDNASSLALSLSQMDKDPVKVELMISAQFDNGHYRYISLTDPAGKVMTERKNEIEAVEAPSWFMRLVPLQVQPGVAQVQSGWSQYGVLKLESYAGFAYRELWNSTLLMLCWTLLIVCLSGYLATVALRVILRPLHEVVGQAEALGNRRFITLPEPKTVEFKSLVAAMNQLSARIRTMLQEESQRLEHLRLEANYDATSSLMNRAYFMSRVDANMNDESFSAGRLVVCHLSDLAVIDQTLGHAETNALLNRLGQALQALCRENSHLLAARLSGPDFAVFSSESADSFTLGSQIKSAMKKAAGLQQAFPNLCLPTVASSLTQQDRIEAAIALSLNTIKDIDAKHTDALHVIGEQDRAKHEDQDETQWRRLLNDAMNAKRLKLASYPVVDRLGGLIHNESPVRLQLLPDQAWLPAGEFISWAIRLDLMTKLDNLVAETAMAELNQGAAPIGLNVSARAIANKSFISHLTTLIKQSPQYASRLWLEVPEQGAFEHLADFRDFCNQLKPLGCKIGIEHVGAQVSRLGELHDLGLDYIKIDVSVIRNIDTNIGNQAYLRGLCLIAHTIGMMAIAEGVQSSEEIACLPELGVDGMTGPGIKIG